MEKETCLVFRINENGQGPEILRQVFMERGWIEYDEETQDEEDWNLWWRTSRFRNSDYEQLFPWQQLNHYPKSTAITRKDSLARHLRRMKGVYGTIAYNFSPVAFNLPNDYTRFVAQYTKMKERSNGKSLFWICKPADLSRGRGIFVFKDLGELQYDCNAVVQQYVRNPLLIAGYKFDLRIYVLVTSFRPLHVYIYQEGLVRFSTEKYDLSTLDNVFAHLTNTSINKHSPSYRVDKERIGQGCKWTLTQLRHYLHSNSINDEIIWKKIINIVILTLVIQASQVPPSKNCFELYGFDIILDANLKPWLLEVNFSPSLGSDCLADTQVKKPMLNDLIKILNFTSEDVKKRARSARSRPSKSDTGFRTKTPTHSNPVSGSGYKQKARGPPVFNKLPAIGAIPNSIIIGDWIMDVNDDEKSFKPIVPGCGLPSVQNPPEYYHPSSASSTSSRASSASSSCAVKVPKKVAKKPKFVPSGQRSFSCYTKRKPYVSKDKRYASTNQKQDQFLGYERNRSCLTDAFSSPLEGGDARLKADSGNDSKSKIVGQDSKGMMKMQPPFLERDDDEGDTPMYSNSDISQKSKRGVRNFNVTNNSNHSRMTSSVYRGAVKSSSSTSVSKGVYFSKRWQPAKNVQSKVFLNRHKAKPAPEQNVGNFFLAFPFNDITRKCAANIDPKTVIKECQKVLKEAENKCSENLAAGVDCGSNEKSMADEASDLWGSLFKLTTSVETQVAAH